MTNTAMSIIDPDGSSGAKGIMDERRKRLAQKAAWSWDNNRDKWREKDLIAQGVITEMQMENAGSYVHTRADYEFMLNEYETEARSNFDSMLYHARKRELANRIAREEIEAYFAPQFTYPETLRDEDLERLPDAEWLIDGILEKGVVAFLVGFTGTIKSFLAMDWGMSVATGKSWLGKMAEPAPVIYIAAEGGRGYKKRSRAWKLTHGRSSAPEMFWKTDPVQVMN